MGCPKGLTQVDDTKSLNATHLLTVRMWAEVVGNDQAEWRGQVRHVTSGETRYFRDWPALVTFLREMLPPLNDDPNSRELEEPECP
jgi:chemotaxis methyl-accepting protein methylase